MGGVERKENKRKIIGRKGRKRGKEGVGAGKNKKEERKEK